MTSENSTPIVVDIDTGHDGINAALQAHGLAQKLGDSYAKKDLTPEEAEENIKELYASIQNGEWTLPSTGGVQLSTMAEAMVRLDKYPTKEKAIEVLKGMSPDTLQRFRNSAKLKTAMAEIRLERAREAMAAVADEVDEVDNL